MLFDSNCASAIWVELMLLLALINLGLTTPARRMYSLLLLMESCFSPATFRLPLDSTSVTVTVMVPEMVLALPRLSVFSSLLSAAGDQEVAPMMLLWPSSVGDGMLTLPLTLRSSVVLEVRFAFMFSTRLTVKVSPTWCAR